MTFQQNIEIEIQQLSQRIIDLSMGMEEYFPTELAALRPMFYEIEMLIKTVTLEDSKKLMTSPLILPLLQRIRVIRARYEFEQEKAQALRLLNSNIRGIKLAENITAPYSSSAIFNSELASRIAGVYNTCLIVGSGPLPATALLFLSHFELEVSCLDISQESGLLSEQIFQTIDHYPPQPHIVSDILSYTDFSTFDMIFVNGLVGLETSIESKSSKSEIVDHIMANKKRDTIVMLRSGYSLSQLFYPQFQPSSDKKMQTTLYPPSSLGRSSIICIEAS